MPDDIVFFTLFISNIVDREARVFNPRLAFRTLLLPLPVRFIRKNPGRCDVFEVKSTSQASDVVIVGKKRSVFDVSSADVAGPFILSLHREEITVTPTLNYGDMYLLLSFRNVGEYSGAAHADIHTKSPTPECAITRALRSAHKARRRRWRRLDRPFCPHCAAFCVLERSTENGRKRVASLQPPPPRAH